MKMNNLLSVKNIIIAISTTLLLSHMANAQCDESCLPQGIGFFTQDDVDNFRNNYPGCTVIEGAVGIMGNEITNLDGLSVLTEIEGDLQVSASNLQNLQGFNNLEVVGGNFLVWQAESLVDFSGLESLVSIGGDLDIQRNNTLSSFQGLESLSAVLNNLYIKDNPLITDFSGLNVLTTVHNIALLDNNMLTDLNGLQNMHNISGSLALTNCASLATVDGLNNLTSINLHLTISGCSTLTDLTAFSSLTAMNGSLFIAFNDNLESLSGLDNINYEDLSGLTIFSNPMLSQCAVNSVCGYVTNNTPTGSDDIGDNAAGCNSWDQVQEACLEISVCENEFTSFSVYPNPGNNYISINNSDMEINSLIIFDHNGNIVLEKLISNTQFVVDIRGLSGGIYQVLISGKGTARKKLVIL